MSKNLPQATMNVRQIIALFKASAEPDAEETSGCLQPDRLAAFLDGGLSIGERAAAEAHLAGCDRCLGRIAALSRATAGQHADTAVPTEVFVRAEALFKAPVPVPKRWRWAVPLTAAAGLLLALTLQLGPGPGPTSEPGRTPANQTRYSARHMLQPSLTIPADGSVVRPGEQVFKWTEVPDTLFYDVLLVSIDGDLKHRERVSGTSWTIPGDLQLKPGGEYYVRIDAYLSDAKYVSSDYRAFRVMRAW